LYLIVVEPQKSDNQRGKNVYKYIKFMFIQTFEKFDEGEAIYKGELDEILHELENRIQKIEKECNVQIVYNGKRLPKELVCAVISTTYIRPSASLLQKL
jgi:hypothetical protein